MFQIDTYSSPLSGIQLANGKVVMALEGGYNLESISKSAAHCVRVLLGGNRIAFSVTTYYLTNQPLPLLP